MMAGELTDRFFEAFAHHLSNTQGGLSAVVHAFEYAADQIVCHLAPEDPEPQEELDT